MKRSSVQVAPADVRKETHWVHSSRRICIASVGLSPSFAIKQESQLWREIRNGNPERSRVTRSVHLRVAVFEMNIRSRNGIHQPTVSKVQWSDWLEALRKFYWSRAKVLSVEGKNSWSSKSDKMHFSNSARWIVLGVAVSFVMMITMPSVSEAKPIDVWDQLTRDGGRMFYKMLEYLSDYDEFDEEHHYQKREGSAPLLQTSNRVESAAKDDKCMLPVRKGVCRALLPRWRWVECWVRMRSCASYYTYLVHLLQSVISESRVRVMVRYRARCWKLGSVIPIFQHVGKNDYDNTENTSQNESTTQVTIVIWLHLILVPWGTEVRFCSIISVI